jgi:Domain of unknown function (DUF4399)
LALGLGGGLAQAQEAPKLIAPSPQAIHAWQVPPPQGAAEAYFVNLKSGDKIETPFLVRFGLSGGWGLAPISAPTGGKSGHHHLLVNRDLPLDFKQPLPFNDQYIHFGKGQMETVLNLAPGNYTLRLLLADDKHLPHFVYSKPVAITVVKKNAVDPASLVKKGIQMLVPGDVVRAPMRVQFHASGLSVGHLAQKQKDTGHFRLTVVPMAKGPDAVMEFVNGQTEVWLAPPPGEYLLKLDLLDNTNPSKSLAETVTTSVRVQ